MADQQTYYLKGHLLGACSCDWGCPCSFEARPTQGFCEGNYAWHIAEGHYQGTPMAGSTFGLFIRFPGAPHEGNGTGVVLVDETLPEDELEAIRDAVVAFGPRGVAGFHQLRTRRAGARRYVDMHVQFRSGITLEDAHGIAHQLQDEIAGRLDGADVLIHLEPEDRVRPGTEIPPSGRRGVSAG